MPHVLTMALAQSVATDPTTNTPSLLGLVEEMGVNPGLFEKAKTEKVAIGPVTFFALLSWSWPKKERRAPVLFSLKLQTAGGQTILLSELTGSIEPPQRRLRVVVNVKGFEIDEPGVYEFLLFGDEVLLGVVPVEIGIFSEGVTLIPGIDWDDAAIGTPRRKQSPKR